MLNLFKKFIVVLIAIWLPLFAGNALAVSVSMQLIAGGSHEVQVREVKQHHSDEVVTPHSAPPLVEYMAEGDCGDHYAGCSSVCAFACTAYAVTVNVEVAKITSSVQSPMSVSLQFISTTFKPLLPPPLT